MIAFLKENWMSLTAIIISLIALFRDLVKDYLKNKNVARENKKAIIKISYINKKLIISNYGKSSAKNIKIEIDNKDILNTENFSVFAKNIDFSLLTSGNSIGIKHLDYMGLKANYKVKVIYDDDYSNNNYEEDVINV